MPPLRAAARQGVRWTSLAAGVTGVVQIVQTLALVRILEAEEFGAMAASMVVVGFAQRFADMGLSNAVVVRAIGPDALSSIFWANVLFGLLLAGAMAAVAPLVGNFYDDPDVTDVVVALSPVFLAAGIGTVPYGIAQKSLAFGLIAKSDIAAALCSLPVAVGAGLAGAGAVALALALVVAASIRSAILLVGSRRDWRPAWRFRPDELREHLGFGGYQMGERGVNFLSSNIDYLLIGRFLGTEALGFYSIAYQLVIRPLTQLNPVIMRVAMPLFARRQRDDAALRAGLLEVTRLIALATFPLLVGLAIVAPVFVPVVLGEEWKPSIVLVQVLAFVGLLKTLGNPLGAVLLAKDRADLGFWLNVLALGITGGAIYAVVREGVEEVAWAYLAATVVGILALQPWVLARTIGLPPFDYYARALFRPAAITAAMAAAALGAYELIGSFGGDATVLAVTTVTGGLVYLVALRAFLAADWQELIALVRSGEPVAATRV